MQQWFYLKNGQQAGPVSVVELQALLAAGTLDPAVDLVWCKGMPEWLPADQIPQLSPSEETIDSAPTLGGADGVAVDKNRDIQGQRGGLSYGDIPFVKPEKWFILMALLYIVGIFLSGAAAPSLAREFVSAMEAWQAKGDPRVLPEFNFDPKALMIFYGGWALSTIGWVISLFYLHRAWVALAGRTNATTPGKAVWFLLIPFFAYYWRFVAYWKWAQEWNRSVADDPAHPNAPRVPENIFLSFAIAYAISFVLAPAGYIAALLLVILMKHVCTAVNYAAKHGKG